MPEQRLLLIRYTDLLWGRCCALVRTHEKLIYRNLIIQDYKNILASLSRQHQYHHFQMVWSPQIEKEFCHNSKAMVI